MKDFIVKIYSNEKFPIILGIIIAVLVVAFIVVYFIGKKDQKKTEESNRFNPMPDAFGQNNNMVNVQTNGFVNPMNQMPMDPNMQAMPNMNMMPNQMPMGPNMMPNPQMMPNMAPMPDPNQFVNPAMPMGNMNFNPMPMSQDMNMQEPVNYEPINFATPMNTMEPMQTVNNENNYINPGFQPNVEPIVNEQVNEPVISTQTFETPVEMQKFEEKSDQPEMPIEEPITPVVDMPYSNTGFTPSSTFSSVNVPNNNEEKNDIELEKINEITNKIEKDLQDLENINNSSNDEDNDDTMAIELPKLKEDENKPLLSENTEEKLNI